MKHPTRSAAGVVEGAAHGTLTGYSTHGCRCASCKAAKATYAREQRAAKATPPQRPDPGGALLAWDAGYTRGRRDAMALVLSAAEAQAPAFARQLRSLAQQMEVQR